MAQHRITVGEELRYDADVKGLRGLSGSYASLGPTNVDAASYGHNIQAAINALPSGGGNVWLSKDVYQRSTSITNTKPNVNLRGTRKGVTQIQLTQPGIPLIVNGTDNGHAWDANDYDGPQGLGLSDLTLAYVGTYTALSNGQGAGYGAGTCGIQDWRGGDVNLDEVRLANFEYGFWGVQSDVNSFDGVDVRACRVGVYAGPRSDQFTLNRVYTALCDQALWLDGVMHPRITNSQFVGDGSATVNAIRVGSQWSRGTQGVVFDQCWFEHAQGAATVEAFIDLGVGDTYQTTDVMIRDPYVLTNAQGSSPYVQYLCKVDNADHIFIEAKARSQGMASLAGIFRQVTNSNRNMCLEGDINMSGIVWSNAGSATLSPIFYGLNGSSADGFLMRRAAGQPAFRFRRQTVDSGDRFIMLIDGGMQWGGGALGTQADTTLQRTAAGTLAMGAANAFKTGLNTTANRPSASTVGQGAQFFDTTLNKPIWSDGTNWRDASGATV